MHIIEIVIDGFKSYATETTITGFDPNFNAITGLNGSGKSNIIDAILFVLGSSSYGKMRAQNMQDLIYKQGQTGVRKASVSIKFNNEDRAGSPMGYEDHAVITVTRQVMSKGNNKYLINGRNATMKKVQSLFRSVQLNVKNPHFMIMQGMIEKVLNMKPAETLGMIKETAGTKMYEDEKKNALRTIASKDKKLEQIINILDEKLTPTLESLREQQAQYKNWLNNKRDVEKLSRLKIAHRFYSAEGKLHGEDNELVVLKEIEELENMIQSDKEVLKTSKKEISKLSMQKEEEMSGQLQKLESDVSSLENKLVQKKNEYENVESSNKKNIKKIENLKKKDVSLNEAFDTLAAEVENKKTKVFDCEQRRDEINNIINNLQTSKQALMAGVAASGEGSNKTLSDQLMDAEKAITSAETDKKVAQQKLAHAETEYAKIKNDADLNDKHYKKQMKEREAIVANIERLNGELESLGFSFEKESTMRKDLRELRSFIRDRQRKIDNLEQMELAKYNLHYDPPSRDFDHSKVRGIVARIVELKDSRYSVALEVSAGSKLWNVIVDDIQTANKLLRFVRRRTTFLPLDNLRPRTLHDKQVTKAYEVAGRENVATAMSLISFEREFESAIKTVFGGTLVCMSTENAKDVCYDNGVRATAVSIDGDIFYPSGVAKGGSRPKTSNILNQVKELNKQRRELQEYRDREQTISDELQKMEDSSNNYKTLKADLTLQQKSLELLDQRISHTNQYQQIQRIKDLEETIATEKNTINECTLKIKEAKQLKADIEEQIETFDKDKQLNKIEMNIVSRKEERESILQTLKDAQKAYITEKTELEDIKAAIVSSKTQIDELSTEVENNSKLLSTMKEEIEKLEYKFNEIKATYESKMAVICNTDSNIARLIAERDRCHKDIEEANLKIKKLNHQLTSTKQSKKKAKATVKKMLEEYSWIERDRELFGKEGTDYDFTTINIRDVEKRLRQLEDEQMNLNKGINNKVMHMFEKADQQYQELLVKKEKIEKDKDQIQKFIETLDEKKNAAVIETYKKVSKDLGNIFSTLLKGTDAALKPVEGGTILDGLEIKVAFGGVWKESLSELSGGQKSLLSLSLILALLLFKPAPMYILDEIDAALDLSHTQNIGEMIKTHFTQSQFIIISLKEGMFNHANAVFKVRNVTGSSEVERIKSADPTLRRKRKRKDR